MELLLFNFQRSETSKACQIFEKEEKQPWEHGGVAQLGEHLPCKQGVMGSNPIISTTRQCREPISREYRRESELQTPKGMFGRCLSRKGGPTPKKGKHDG